MSLKMSGIDEHEAEMKVYLGYILSVAGILFLSWNAVLYLAADSSESYLAVFGIALSVTGTMIIKNEKIKRDLENRNKLKEDQNA